MLADGKADKQGMQLCSISILSVAHTEKYKYLRI